MHVVVPTELVCARPIAPFHDVGYIHLVGMVSGRPLVAFHRQDGDTTVINVAAWTGGGWQTRAVHREGTLLDMERISPSRLRVYYVLGGRP